MKCETQAEIFVCHLSPFKNRNSWTYCWCESNAQHDRKQKHILCALLFVWYRDAISSHDFIASVRAWMFVFWFGLEWYSVGDLEQMCKCSSETDKNQCITHISRIDIAHCLVLYRPHKYWYSSLNVGMWIKSLCNPYFHSVVLAIFPFACQHTHHHASLSHVLVSM